MRELARQLLASTPCSCNQAHPSQSLGATDCRQGSKASADSQYHLYFISPGKGQSQKSRPPTMPDS